MTALRRDSWAFMAFLGLLAGVPPLSIDMGIPGFPEMQADLKTDAAGTALTMSMFLIGFAIGPLVLGPLADSFGRRPVLILGMSVFVLAGLGCALAPTIGAMQGARFAQGIGAGAGGTLLIARDIGMDIGTVMRVELSACIEAIRYYAEVADKVMGEVAPTADGLLGLVHRQPVGVVAAIVPWNSPMMVSAWKIAPALAAGNSVILKPAETASLALLRLGDYARAAGLPDGVLNILTGRGAVCGAALGLHMDVDVLAFTGSGPVGRRLLEYSARSNLKHVYLELGGKSPNIVFADADLKKAAQFAAISIFANCGQICAANSRLLVEASIKDAFLAEVMQVAQGFVPGDPLDPTTRMGAVNSAAQLGRDLAHVAGALAEGAVLRMSGARTREDSGGYYMQPTILEVTPEMSIAREEVFGPVLSVLEFTTDEEAITIANSTVYGLSSSVWTTNLKRAHRMVREIEAGVVNVNTWGGGDLSLPFGGVKESGNGYDRSLHALDKYTHLKSALFDLT